jgi:hypothetical protein
MWSLDTLKKLNAEAEAKLNLETAEGELEFEEAKKLNEQDKD